MNNEQIVQSWLDSNESFSHDKAMGDDVADALRRVLAKAKLVDSFANAAEKIEAVDADAPLQKYEADPRWFSATNELCMVLTTYRAQELTNWKI
jgi:hypothetical protein